MALQLMKLSGLQNAGFIFSGNTRDVDDIEENTVPRQICSSSSGICFRQMSQGGMSTEVAYIEEYSSTETCSATVQECTDVPTEDALSDLHQVVAMIEGGRLLPEGTHEFEELLTQAVARQGRPVDIAAWARQLAEDVGDLTD